MSRRLRWIAVVAIIGGLIVRTFPLLRSPEMALQTCDGRAYLVLGLAWAEGRGLYLSDPSTIQACGGNTDLLGPSHHWAPALPIIEGLLIRLIGNTTVVLVLTMLTLSFLAVLVAWWTTRDLFGRDAALLVAAAVSLEWTGVIFGTWFGYSENLVVITLTLTLWAILRALRDDRFLLLAGLFAGLGYLSKASIGWFFLIAGFGGFVWRLAFRGWSVLRNRWYLAAIAVFAIPVVGWGYRNISLFWDGTAAGLLHAWQTSAPTAEYVGLALGQPGQLLIGLAGKLPVLVVGLTLPYLPLLRGFCRPLARWKEEEVSGLWLAVGLIFALGWFFTAAFWVVEQTNLLWADPIRYVAPAQIPLLWLLVRDGGPFSTRSWTISFLILAILCVYMPFLMFPEGNVLGMR